MYAIGHDFGSSHAKCALYMNGKEKTPFSIPSATREGQLEELSKNKSGMGQNITTNKSALLAHQHVIEFDGVEYYVGELAIDQSVNNRVRTIGNASRYWSLPSLLTLLVNSCHYIHESSYELLVVTGLPISAYEGANIARVKERLNGTYTFKYNDVQHTVRVKVGKVLMEAAGAMILGGIDEGIQKYGVIDVGSFTTDIYSLNGLTPVGDECDSMEAGMYSVVKKVARRFNKKYTFPLNIRQEDCLLPCYLSNNYEPLGLTGPQKHGMITDIMCWTKEQINTLASSIQNSVSSVWRTGSQGLVAANFARVDVVGGGAYYLLDAIQKYIPDAQRPRRPEYANVRGYAYIAEQLAEQVKIA